MTTDRYSNALISIVTDISSDLPAEDRYQRLLDVMLSIFPCDAAALLQLEGQTLKPLAMKGLSNEAMGRRFVVSEQPRLARLLHSRTPVRFAADSELADPYDGLVEGVEEGLDVHDCMGVSLYIDQEPWGALTLDALDTGTLDNIDPIEFRTFISLTEATIKAALRIAALEERIEHDLHVARALQQADRPAEIIGKSPLIKKLKEEIAIVARSELTVLIQGETGVGKELVAKQVHALSSRSDRALVHVNCAALPAGIAESELFGHIKGAFTGATSDRAGKFEIANGGTLFLDEIGELSLSLQAKMLRALQSGEIQRVGCDEHIQVDVRIIVATNRDLKNEIKKGSFRADLYHRLSVYPVNVPPLKRRGKDILLLSGFLLEGNQSRLGVRGLRLDKFVSKMLQAYDWPGNVRELEHLLSRAALKAVAEQGRESRTVTIKPEHLDITERHLSEEESIDNISQLISVTALDLKEATDEFQKQLINDRLEKNGNNSSAAAKELGINKSNFYRLLKRLGIHPKQ